MGPQLHLLEVCLGCAKATVAEIVPRGNAPHTDGVEIVERLSRRESHGHGHGHVDVRNSRAVQLTSDGEAPGEIFPLCTEQSHINTVAVVAEVGERHRTVIGERRSSLHPVSESGQVRVPADFTMRLPTALRRRD